MVDAAKAKKIQEEMERIQKADNPTQLEKTKLIRYLFNARKLTKDAIIHKLPGWEEDEIAGILADVQKEKQKPKPKRYYVSLKEPLEEGFMK